MKLLPSALEGTGPGGWKLGLRYWFAGSLAAVNPGLKSFGNSSGWSTGGAIRGGPGICIIWDWVIGGGKLFGGIIEGLFNGGPRLPGRPVGPIGG